MTDRHTDGSRSVVTVSRPQLHDAVRVSIVMNVSEKVHLIAGCEIVFPVAQIGLADRERYFGAIHPIAKIVRLTKLLPTAPATTGAASAYPAAESHCNCARKRVGQERRAHQSSAAIASADRTLANAPLSAAR